MPTTSNFGWTTPADTDLVKDGAAAIRTLGNGIDTSFLDLKGGTSGQVLSKNSNTDLDYTWVTPNVGDITEVQAGTGISVASGTGPIPVVTNSMATEITAKGDLIVGTGSGTFDNLPAGTNGYTLVADSSVSPTGLKWAAPAASDSITLLSTTTLSGQTTSITGISQSYTNLIIIITKVNPSQDSFVTCNFRNSSTDLSVIRGGRATDNLATPVDFTSNSTTYNLANGCKFFNASNNNNIVIELYNYSSTDDTLKAVNESSVLIEHYNGGIGYCLAHGFIDSTSAVDALFFDLDGTRTFQSGTVRIYGVK